MPPLSVDVLIITRNRPAALSLSLPRILRQDYKPQRIIVVDASEDPQPVAEVVRAVAEAAGPPILLLRSPRGTSLQRNLGLKHVTADVTLFLDDDSLLLDGAIAAIMRIYARDREGVIGGVCTREATEAPPEILAEARARYRMTALDRVKLALAPLRNRFEALAVPDPLQLHGRSRRDVRPPPPWLAAENAVLVEFMTGFRMSFRSALIKHCGFDEALSNYGLGEDIDVSFAALRTHLLVGARNAGIYHYKDPGQRAPGRVMGVTHALNCAYIVCKHAPPGSPARSGLRRFWRYKLALYALGAHRRSGREKFLGALSAYRRLPILMQAPPGELAAVYLALRRQCLDEQAAPAAVNVAASEVGSC